MSYQIPERLKELAPYQPVTEPYRIRLDANESFVSLPQAMLDRFSQAVREIPYNRYPDPGSTELCRAFAKHYGIAEQSTVAGNGSDELINLILETFVRDGETVVVTEPDFSMYAVYARLLNLRVVTYQKGENYAIDAEALAALAQRENAKLVIFSNPCNPTGRVLRRAQVRRLIESTSALVVLDEAYMDFADESLLSEVERFDNLIILRTLSKAFAGAACRLGFAVAAPALITVLRAAKSPYNVNAVSQKFGEILLSDPAFIRTALEKLMLGRDFLYENLSKLGSVMGVPFRVLPTSTNFVYVETERADDIDVALKEKGICVRKFPKRLRISTGSRLELMELIDVLKSLQTEESNENR